LTEDPRNRNDVTLYYLGWDRSGNAGTGGVGIHHPEGDVKKISTYSATPVSSTCLNSNFWDIWFIQTANGYSVMQPVSSGSPLINSNRRIIGQLYGPGYCSLDQCNNPGNQRVAYGKFSVSWTGNGATDNRRKLQPWLNPANDVMTLNGLGRCNPAVTSFTFSGYTQGGTQVSPCPNEYFYIYPDIPIPASQVLEKQWQVSGCTLLSSTNTSAYVKAPSNVYASFTVQYRYRNRCGWSPWSTVYGGTRNCAGGEEPYRYPLFRVASTGKTLTIETQDVTLPSAGQTVNYTLANLITGTAVATGRIPASGATLDFAHLPAGIYLLRIETGINTFDTHKVVLR
jgi:hypothetical protein